MYMYVCTCDQGRFLRGIYYYNTLFIGKITDGISQGVCSTHNQTTILGQKAFMSTALGALSNILFSETYMH